MSTQQSMPHNGNLLWKMMVQQHLTKSELAVAMNTNQMAIKRFIEKSALMPQTFGN